MNKKNIVLAAISFALFGASMAIAGPPDSDFRIPRDRNDRVPLSVRDIGVRLLQVRYTTQPVGIGLSFGTGSEKVQAATVAIYGVFTGSAPLSMGTTEMFLFGRSSDTANVTSELMFPPVSFSSTTRNTLVVFNPPKLAPDGFCANISSQVGHAVVFYRILSTNTSDLDYFLPVDVEGDLGSIEFYGAKVASETFNSAGLAATTDRLGYDSLDMTTNERIIETRPNLLYCVESGTATDVSNFAVFEDSASIIGDAPDMLPPLFYNSAMSLYYPFTFDFKPGVYRSFCFPWPIVANFGLTERTNTDADRMRVTTRPLRSMR